MKKISFMIISFIFIGVLGQSSIAFGKEKKEWKSILTNMTVGMTKAMTNVLDVRISFPMECLDDRAKCDCENTYESHENKLKDGIKKEERKIICNCGGILLDKVVNTGKWNFSSSVKCIHGMRGNDYIYKRRIIIAYECTKCSFYTEMDREETKKECKGV